MRRSSCIRYYSTWTEQMPLKNGTKLSNSTSTTKSMPSLKKKLVNGDSLREELHGMIPDLSSSNEEDLEENESSEDSPSSSTPSSDDEGGVFDARFDDEQKHRHLRRSCALIDRTYRPIDPSDDMIEFDRGHNQIDVSFSSPRLEIECVCSRISSRN